MKKIMFNDKYGLTESVLTGRKTMTRRIIPLCENDLNFLKITERGEWLFSSRTCLDGARPAYKIGEELAVAQRYWDLRNNDGFYEALQRADPSFPLECISGEKGCYNKMFVRADWMPHRIRITNIKAERLQDISDEDCAKEGIIHVNWRQYLKQDMDDFSPQPYKDHDLWTLSIFEESFRDAWAEQKPGEYAAESAKVAFAVLIFKLMGKKVWEQNPLVFAYEFELVR